MILKSENVILFLYMINEDSRAIFRDTVNSLEDSSFFMYPLQESEYPETHHLYPNQVVVSQVGTLQSSHLVLGSVV